ncbi:caveolin-3-like [Lineus longissimus]|uniref:caveolin-3-like n=1 Tax=Lineus longissimus TaxID=88925 RepID=UPI002B4C6262
MMAEEVEMERTDRQEKKSSIHASKAELVSAAEGLDMDDRDPNNINDHVKVLFEDVFGEPEGAHSIDCVWRNSYKCFTGGKRICYIVLTTICALPLALCWGCSFACLAFEHIWQFAPCLKTLNINIGFFQKILTIFVKCCLDPLCESCGLMFSKIAVRNQ